MLKKESYDLHQNMYSYIQNQKIEQHKSQRKFEIKITMGIPNAKQERYILIISTNGDLNILKIIFKNHTHF